MGFRYLFRTKIRASAGGGRGSRARKVAKKCQARKKRFCIPSLLSLAVPHFVLCDIADPDLRRVNNLTT